MWSNVNAYFNILQVHSFQKEYIFMFPKQKIHTLLYLVFNFFFLQNMQVMLNGILKLQHIFPIQHDIQVIQTKYFDIIYDLLYAWVFYGSYKEERTISHHNTRFKLNIRCTNIVVLNMFY